MFMFEYVNLCFGICFGYVNWSVASTRSWVEEGILMR